MKKEFSPFELAIKLKVLGFDEPCFYWYTSLGHFVNAGKSNQPPIDDACSAPTFSKAFRWFRERHFYHSINTYHSVSPNKPFGVSIDYLHESGKWDYIDLRGEVEFETYEEAEVACLTKLIEIVETRTK